MAGSEQKGRGALGNAPQTTISSKLRILNRPLAIPHLDRARAKVWASTTKGMPAGMGLHQATAQILWAVRIDMRGLPLFVLGLIGDGGVSLG